jgi:SAM-dependent methyltransferase
MAETNLLFYEKLQLDNFQYFAEILGLDGGADIAFIYPYLQKARHIVELGAGYGRVVDKLLELGFEGKITAVERVTNSSQYLKQKFGERINVVQDDIRHFMAASPVDCILWPWSGILELNKSEQSQTIRRLKDSLVPDGLLIIETPYQKVHAVGELGPDNLVRVKTEWGVLEAYLAGEEEIRLSAEEAGYESFEKKQYFTSKGLERVFYLLRK